MAKALPYMLKSDADIFELITKFLRHDLIAFRKMDMENVLEIEKLLYNIALSSEQLSLSSLSQRIGINKTQVHRYLQLLNDGLILKEVRARGKVKALQKDKKIYLTPPIRTAILDKLKKPRNRGLEREEFFVQHAFHLGLSYDPGSHTDFYIGKESYEIGGPGKTRRQKPDYLVVDSKLPGKNELPLVAFGFLY